MPTRSELSSALDQSWRSHDYEFALYCLHELLTRYRGSRRDDLLASIVADTRYGNLAAAFDAEDLLALMERVSKRAFGADLERRKRVGPEELALERRQALEAMRWLRVTVERAGRMSLVSLGRLAAEANVAKVKSRLAWMEKAGKIHIIGEDVIAGPSPVAQFEPMGTEINGVPRLRPYASFANMDEKQLRFYDDYQARHRAGEFVDIEEQWSYAFALLGDYERELEDDLTALEAVYRRFDAEYPGSPVAGFTVHTADRLFEAGNWQGGFDLLMPNIPMDIYLTLADTVADSRLRSGTVAFWTTEGQKTTATFRGELAEVNDALQEILDVIHEDLGRSVIADLWQRLIVERAPGAAAPRIGDEFGRFMTQEKLDDYLEAHDRAVARTGLSPIPDRSLDSLGLAVQEIPEGSADGIEWPAPYCHTYWFEQIAGARIQSLYRDAENIVRRRAGMPSVGEGWISEVVLLRAIREAFPNQQVVHQARPGWLGKQSLDIYLPDVNIAIEYQGAQHSGPVSHFGGERAYERQHERDSRKRSVCLANGCHLIEVHPGYELGAVVAEVQGAIEKVSAPGSPLAGF